jgi:hypothetical protein
VEREVLAQLANPPGEVVYEWCDATTGILMSLVARGCASHEDYEDGEIGFDITDLGRLALRVSLPMEGAS